MTALAALALGDLAAATTAAAPTPVSLADINLEDTEILAAGSEVFFVADVGGGGPELWRSDGSGASLVKEIGEGSVGSDPELLATVGSKLFFTADDGTSGRELWVSDGTAAGTNRVRDVDEGQGDGVATDAEAVAVDGTLFFVADDGSGADLWRSGGTAGTTARVAGTYTGYANPRGLTEANGRLFFAAATTTNGRQLWSTDVSGTSASAVSDVAGEFDPQGITVIGSELWFWARDDAHGVELWKSDGTGPGTVLVDDLTPGPADTTFVEGVAVGGRFFFTTLDAGATKLWVRDNDGPATVLPSGDGAARLTSSESTVFFTASDVDAGQELWSSDGTVSGTGRVADINDGLADSEPRALTDVGGTLYFSARLDTPTPDRELWTSDGTESGTTQVANLTSGSSNPRAITATPDALFFAADADDGLSDLWTLRFADEPSPPPPPPAAPPITAPAKGKANATNGSIAFSVSVPAAGVLTVGPASAKKPLVRTVTRQVPAGRTAVTLKPTKLGKQKLAKKLARAIAKGKRVGKLTVRVRFALTPTTGARSAASKAYTLRLKRRR